MRLLCVALVFCVAQCYPQLPGVGPNAVPTDPKALARLVGDAFFAESDVSCNGKQGHNMLSWNYGGALLLDGMWQSVMQFGFDDWVPKIAKYLDAYTKDPDCRGYKLVCHRR